MNFYIYNILQFFFFSIATVIKKKYKFLNISKIKYFIADNANNCF